MNYQGKADLQLHLRQPKQQKKQQKKQPEPLVAITDHFVDITRVLHQVRIITSLQNSEFPVTHIDVSFEGLAHSFVVDSSTVRDDQHVFICSPISAVDLPAFQVVREARDFLEAANLLEEAAHSGKSDLFMPAAMNAGLASEQYLKAFLVETDPDKPSFVRMRKDLPKGNPHDLHHLYQIIPISLRQSLDAVSESVSPGFPLEELIKACSKLFTTARYGYEAASLQILRSEVFELAPHLDKVLTEMTSCLTYEEWPQAEHQNPTDL